ncbi:tyrosine-type recombinase/integrase [Paracoccus fistulariae]|uniref:Tyrosine-type recombinase/integrase n=2 Tax=Paracoccus fistulariae TaxID=658446 RepID=A0ABY7SL95_9RHOB|nr:tyrosine-type recombinase/integrase [Paracoccus fistulariae]
MRDWCNGAGLPQCTSHGLRKACARRLAEAGAIPHEIMAVAGHETLAEVERYTNKKRNALGLPTKRCSGFCGSP